MKTVNLTTNEFSIQELFEMARAEPVLITEGNGDRFLLTFTDDFDTEVELLRRNHEFLAFHSFTRSLAADSEVPGLL